MREGAVGPRVFGFHAQQAAEKLHLLCTDSGLVPPVSRAELAALSPYAVEIRYGAPLHLGEGEIDRAATLELIRKLRDWVRAE